MALVSSAFADIKYKETIVMTSGETIVRNDTKNNKVLVKIYTHELDIGKPSDPRPKIINNNCTYSRILCSIVDRIEIYINDKPIFIPKSVFCDLADIGTAALIVTNKINILTLGGGDASESYRAIIKFNSDRIISREKWDNEAGEKSQETTYFKIEMSD